MVRSKEFFTQRMESSSEMPRYKSLFFLWNMSRVAPNFLLDKVEIFSINGQKLLSFYNVSMLDIDLDEGLYLIYLYKEEETSIHKIIIN